MQNVKNEIIALNKVLSLNGDNLQQIIEKALRFIGEINTEEIVKNTEEVANLYYLLLNKYNEIDVLDSNIDYLIKMAFENIEIIAEDTEPSVSSCSTNVLIIKFLRKLHMMCENDLDLVSIPNEMHEQFDNLCENLENIRIIFKINIDGKELFPIAKLLASVISKDFRFSTLDAKTLNTLLLALQVFTTNEYSNENQKLQRLIDDCNLKCLRYLESTHVKKFSDETWRLNFQKNGVLILGDIDQNQIYIRHEDRNYFSSLNSVEQLKVSDEKNSAGDRIASYYEYKYHPDYIFTSIDELLLSQNQQLLETTLKEIYNNSNFNVFYKQAFLQKDNELLLVNPFTSKDKYIVFGNKEQETVIANRERVTADCLNKFNLQIFRGKGLNNATIGLIAYLLSIENIDISKLTQNLGSDSSVQNQIINNWTMSTKTPMNSLVIIYRYFIEQLAYTQSNAEMNNRVFEGLFLYPNEFDHTTIIELLRQFHTGLKCTSILFEKLRITLNKENEPTITKNDIVLDINKDDIPKELYEYEQYVYALQDDSGEWVFSSVIDTLGKISAKIKDLNRYLLETKSLGLFTENNIQFVSDYMILHKDALLDQHNIRINFDSMMKFRLANNIVRYSITTSIKWTEFMGVLSKHQKVEFSKVFDSTLSLDEKGVLFVPKERADADTTLNFIYLKYCRRQYVRNHDVYMPEISFIDNEYYYRESRIDQVVFVFDTLQSGTSTKRTLSFYFENHDKTSLDGVPNRAQKYYCNGYEIGLDTIIKTNKPKISIYFMFGTDDGVSSIEEYINTQSGLSHDLLKDATIYCNQKITSKVDQDLMKLSLNLYKVCNMKPNQYPIIREFNQPKCNIFPPEMMKPDCVFALFVIKKEFRL